METEYQVIFYLPQDGTAIEDCKGLDKTEAFNRIKEISDQFKPLLFIWKNNKITNVLNKKQALTYSQN